MSSRYERWSLNNIFDAKDAELACPHGTAVVVKTDMFGKWFVISDGKRFETEAALDTAAFLNAYGVLPKSEHEAYVFEHRPG